MPRGETHGTETPSHKGVLSRLIDAVSGEGTSESKPEDKDLKATDLLKEDHDKVRKLFKEYKDASEGAKASRKRLIEQISQELEVHTRLEEQIFYPACRKLHDPEARRIVGESMEEHTIVKRLIKELAGLGPDEEAFEAKATVLRESVEHHADEEESDLFPPAERELDEEELLDLGRRMSALKTRLSAQGNRTGRARGVAKRTPSRRRSNESGVTASKRGRVSKRSSGARRSP